MFRCMHTLLNDRALQKKLVLVPQQWIFWWKKHTSNLIPMGSADSYPKVNNPHVRYWLLQGESWQHGAGFLIHPWCGKPEILYDCKCLLSWGWVYATRYFGPESKQNLVYQSKNVLSCSLIWEQVLEASPALTRHWRMQFSKADKDPSGVKVLYWCFSMLIKHLKTYTLVWTSTCITQHTQELTPRDLNAKVMWHHGSSAHRCHSLDLGLMLDAVDDFCSWIFELRKTIVFSQGDHHPEERWCYALGLSGSWGVFRWSAFDPNL